MMSRRKPVMRDSSVKPPTVKMRPIMDWPCESSPTHGHAPLCHAGAPGRKAERPRSSGAERPAHRRDDAVLRRLVEVAVHGQADDLSREPLADRQAAVGHGVAAVGL